jgi:hypothetical protein
MKQTAVEWLEEQIKDIFYVAQASEMNKAFESIYQQAKEMEKQQIIDAYNEGDIQLVNGEQYYNQTFREIEKL